MPFPHLFGENTAPRTVDSCCGLGTASPDTRWLLGSGCQLPSHLFHGSDSEVPRLLPQRLFWATIHCVSMQYLVGIVFFPLFCWGSAVRSHLLGFPSLSSPHSWLLSKPNIWAKSLRHALWKMHGCWNHVVWQLCAKWKHCPMRLFESPSLRPSSQDPWLASLYLS